MMNRIEDKTRVKCDSEYGTLKKVFLCEPQYMEIQEAINDTQKQYMKENINQSLAMEQHQAFEKALIDAGVEVIKLTPKEDLPEQVFTRDIGFVLGGTAFVSAMAEKVRQGEEDVLSRWMEQRDVAYKRISMGSIEGGDVIIDGKRVFVGVSDRTRLDTIRALAAELPEAEVIPVPFNPNYLHLDCTFNILSETEALVFPEAFEPEVVEQLAKMYKLIEVSSEEQFTMGTNVLSIGGGRVLSLPVNRDVNYQLRQRGYDVMEIDFSEIIKSGGSFRCCSMPLVRE
ncbi:hypothetical protein FLK61_41380 [Paenalkalicoccus suaedae]|uniref:N-dimethylarginine dimethylaminohydrolase n=1 Tax=Paenalkalicoccus suaedae TaxID=2592382 RepID=A0A859FJT8_9BACI|nr:dimethylarginine dimethylaminohydrolase family protein [Paenalkalicoccus suaedae]QKS73046.1 hypothetical protein FLK61_41380 [Paenalkalicoccus suaedae]